MKFTIFLAVFVILANAYLTNANPLSMFEMADILQTDAGSDRNECAKKAVNAVRDESTDNIGDFHAKSDINKIKTLHKEVIRMMQNGNSAWRAYARIYKIMEEENGGEEAFLDSYFGNYTVELAKGTLNSTLICTILSNTKVFYKEAKKAIGKSIGRSDTFWPMIKDMMTSADLEHKDIRDYPTIFFAAGSIMQFALPDEMISMIGMAMQMVPEETFRQKIREMGPAIKPFPFNQS